MDREDKLLAKCLIFAGSFIFTILSFITLVQTAIDFNQAKALETTLQKGANLTPLLVVFFMVTIITIAIVIASFFFTFVKSEKAKTWQNRLVLGSIIMLVLSVALYTIMKCSSYISFSAIYDAIHNNSSAAIVRKFYTSQFTTSMLLTSISLVINLFLIHQQNKFDVTVESTATTEQAPEEISSEQSQLEKELASLKEQLHIKNLKDQIAELNSQLGNQTTENSAEPTTVSVKDLPAESSTINNDAGNDDDNQINIDQAIINEPIIDKVINSTETNEDVVEEDAEIKEFEEILGLNDDNK